MHLLGQLTPFSPQTHNAVIRYGRRPAEGLYTDPHHGRTLYRVVVAALGGSRGGVFTFCGISSSTDVGRCAGMLRDARARVVAAAALDKHD